MKFCNMMFRSVYYELVSSKKKQKQSQKSTWRRVCDLLGFFSLKNLQALFYYIVYIF